MTQERERTKEEISADLLQRDDVRNALAGGADLPEGARGGMEQAQPNQGQLQVGRGQAEGEQPAGETGSTLDNAERSGERPPDGSSRGGQR